MNHRALALLASLSAVSIAVACGDETSNQPAATTDTDAGMSSGGPEPGADSGAGKDAGALVPLWSRQYGEASAKEQEDATAVATDAAGNLILIGEIWGAADFGGGVLTSAASGTPDIFVAKLDPNGKHLWSKRFGDAEYQTPEAVAVDAAGNIVVVGKFGGVVDFGGGKLTSAGGEDVFVAKLDPDGKHLWSKRFGDIEDNQEARSVSLDKAGNVVVAGAFAGTLDFGGGGMTATGGADAFVMKLDASGKHLWSYRYGGDGKTMANAVKTDSAGNVVVLGVFGFTVDFSGSNSDAGVGNDAGTGPVLTSLGGADDFVVKLDPSGKHVWSKRFGGAAKRQPENEQGLAIDKADNLLVATSFEGTFSFGGTDLVDLGYPTFGATNIAVAKLSPAGDHVWSKGFGDASRQFPKSVATDRQGNVLLSGQISGTINFTGADGGAHDLTSKQKPTFLAMLDSSGAHVWSKLFGTKGEVLGGNATFDPSDSVIFAGRLSGEVDFGDGPRKTADADYDVIVAKLPPGGH